MTHTISSELNGPVVMASNGPVVMASNGPVVMASTSKHLTITATGAVIAQTAGQDGVDGGPGTAWTIGNSGIISAAYGVGVSLAGAGSVVTNAGSISGGVVLADGGVVQNQARGVISGGTGVYMTGTASGSVTNLGQINGTNGFGVDLASGGTVTNKAGASITGGIDVAQGRVNNAGVIAGGVLDGAGLVSNAASGTIAAAYTGVSFGAGPASLSNAGVITGSGQAGAAFYASGTLTNKTGGTIAGADGVYMGGPGKVTNAGLIDGTSLGVVMAGTLSNQNGGVIQGGAVAVILAGGGSMTNAAGALIEAGGYGVKMSGTATLTNAGSITSGGVAVSMKGGTLEVLRNQAPGVISGGAAVPGGPTQTGVYTYAPAAITNAGQISGGVDMVSGGTLTNTAGGVINGGISAGQAGQNASDIVNGGTILGGISLGTNASDRLVVQPGAVFGGTVDGGAGVLELSKGTGALSWVGGNFTDFSDLTIDKGGSWTLSGANAFADVTNNGTVAITGSLYDSGSTSGTGIFDIAAGATLEVAAAQGAGAKMAFLAGGALVVDNAAAFGANVGMKTYAGPQITAFANGASIDIQNFAAAGAAFTYAKTTGLLQITDQASQTATIGFLNAGLGSVSFHISSDGGAIF